MPLWILIGALMSPVGATSQQFGETCAGTEVVQVGSQPPKTVPYALTFSVDLSNQTYCAGRCDKGSSWRIRAVSPGVITLADVPGGGAQSRHTTFDVAHAKLEDSQVIKLGAETVSRRAIATCKPAPFRSPSH